MSDMTLAIAERAVSAAQARGLVPGQILASTGAVPISKDGRVIGAIGCGGGTGEQDHQC